MKQCTAKTLLGAAGLFACAVLNIPVAHGLGISCDGNPPTVLSVPPISVPANPVVGRPIGEPDGYVINAPNGLRCTYDPTVVIDRYSHMGMPANTPWTGLEFGHSGLALPVYATGLPGVGFVMMAKDRDMGPMKRVTTGVTILRGPERPGLPVWGMEGRVIFIATGPIQGGAIPSRYYAHLSAGYYQHHQFHFGNIIVNPPRKPTCSVSTPAIAINLDKVAAREFTGVGSVAGSASDTIALQCSGGEGPTRDVWVTLTDQTNTANRGDQLSLTPTSTAQGIALQLLHNGTLLRYGPDSAAEGNPNQWQAGAAGNGVFNIPLAVRYIQTEAVVKPGSANGLVTFTMSYR